MKTTVTKLTKLLFALMLAMPMMAVPAGAQTAATDYTIQNGDVLKVRVWPDETLGGEFPVDVQGNVYLPFVGELKVSGMSLSTLEKTIRAGFSQAIKNPVVSVTPLFRVAVYGGVQQPGVFVVDPTETLLDVIARAGGFSPRAQPQSVQIMRGANVIHFDARSALNGVGDATMVLHSHDRVVVPEKRGIAWQTILSTVQLLATLVVVANQLGK